MKLHVANSHISFASSYHTRCARTEFEEVSRFSMVWNCVINEFLVSRGLFRKSFCCCCCDRFSSKCPEVDLGIPFLTSEL